MFRETITFDTFVRLLGYALVVVCVVLLITRLSNILLPFAIGWLLAYLHWPLVKFLQHRVHLRSRALSIIAAMLLVGLVVSGVLWMIIPPMMEQFQKVGELATAYIHQLANVDSIPDAIKSWSQDHKAELEQFVRSDEFTKTLKSIVPQVFHMLDHTVSLIASIVASLIALMYMFFILMDYEYLTSNWVKLFPKRRRTFWTGLASDAGRALDSYIRGQGLVALIMGVLFCIGFTIIGFPMAIGLGILIGIMDLVPYLHTLALVPTALLALLKAADTGQNFWIVFATALAVFAVVQVIIDMIVTPKVMGKAMNLNPAVLLLSLSVWGALLGFIGLIIALPLTTLLIAYYQRYITREEDVQEIEATQ